MITFLQYHRIPFSYGRGKSHPCGAPFTTHIRARFGVDCLVKKLVSDSDQSSANYFKRYRRQLFDRCSLRCLQPQVQIFKFCIYGNTNWQISVVVYHTPSERASMIIPPKSSIVPARPFCRYPTAMAFLSIIATSIRTISHPDLSLDSAFHTPHSNILV